MVRSPGDKTFAALIVAILALVAAWLSVPWVNEIVIAAWRGSNNRPITDARGTPFLSIEGFVPSLFNTLQSQIFFSFSSLPTGSNEVSDKQVSESRKVDRFSWSWAASGFIAERTLGPVNEIGVIARPESPIRAMATGIVYEIGNDLPNKGVYLKIKHGDRITSNYLIKNGSIKVSEGQKVNRGDLIAVRMDNEVPLMVFFQITKDGMLVDCSVFLPPLPLPPLKTSPRGP